MENGSLMTFDSIAECLPRGALCNNFDLHLVMIGIENQILVFILSGRALKTCFTVVSVFFTVVV